MTFAINKKSITLYWIIIMIIKIIITNKLSLFNEGF
jgi:hypothetical protein